MVRLLFNPSSLGLVLLLCSVFNIGVLAVPKVPVGQHLRGSVRVNVRKSAPMINRRSEPLYIRAAKGRSGERRDPLPTTHEKKGDGQQLVQLATTSSRPWVPAGETDSRSPCPVLNMLANHNYLPHDGRNIKPAEVSSALQHILNVAPSLADSLMTSVQTLLNLNGTFELHDLALHGLIEHDASLVHLDAGGYHWRRRWLRGTYAPVTPDPTLLAQLIADSSDGKTMNLADFAKARVRRENASPELSSDVKQFVQGEPSLLLGVFGGAKGWMGSMSVEGVRQLFGEERLPDDFVRVEKPLKLEAVVKGQQRVASYMGKIKASLAIKAASASAAAATQATSAVTGSPRANPTAL